LEEQLLRHQGELNEKKSRADVAKAELDLANSSHRKEQEVLDKMMATLSTASTGIKDNEKYVGFVIFLSHMRHRNFSLNLLVDCFIPWLVDLLVRPFIAYI